ncbi:MAG: hypothetical protein JRC86_00790 [Deltaproteobacteria bacterium]|nr:hypothetical protein [Deltaproteobacteria bacterium]
MKTIGELLVVNTEKTIRGAAIAASREAILRTPVKTGKARINWKVNFGTFKPTVRKGPGTPRVEANRQLASTEALINAANRIKGWKVGSGSIYIGNGVDYIFDLDRGTSRQALSGMSKFAIAAAQDVLRKGKLLKKNG